MKTPIHLNALRAFEASARHQSFSMAAEELHVTPAAVGQLVRTLENWLGFPLFRRVNRGQNRLQMTPAAQAALPDIRVGLDRLAAGLEKLQSAQPDTTLTVTLSPAFAAKWLLPRFEHFHARFPDLDLRFETTPKSVDFAVQDVDIGVRYGAGHWPGLRAEKLLEEEIYPVCSPAFLAEHPHLCAPAGLGGCTLIHDLSMDENSGFATWQRWLKLARVEDISSARSLKINNSAAVLQAAMAGQGVALARSVMAQDDVASGRLIRLFPDIRQVSELAYYIVYREDRAHQANLLAFRNWLLQEARAPHR